MCDEPLAYNCELIITIITCNRCLGFMYEYLLMERGFEAKLVAEFIAW